MALSIAFAGFRHSHIFGLFDTARKHKNVNITGCFEENEAEKEKIEKNHKINFSYKSYEEILNDSSVQAVAIGDYYGKRGKMVIDALKHGKHVICDKPICTSLAELEEIEKLSEEKNLEVCCMLDLRYMPQTEKVKEIIESGTIGDIINISFTGQHCLDYENRPGWYFEEGKHGGTINDIAIHGIDLLRFLTKKDVTKINFAKTRNAFAYKNPDFKDCGHLIYEMDNILVSADVSYAAPKCNEMLPTYWDFYIWGTKGMINFRYSDNSITVYTDKKKTISCPDVKIGYLDAFIKEINGENTIMNTKDILKSQRQVLEIQKVADE